MLSLLVALCLGWTQDAALAAESVTGQVLDAGGEPVADLKVTLNVGLARYELAPGFDRWLSVLEKEVKTDAQGRFEWKELPEGAVVTAFARRPGEFAVADGHGELALQLAETGGLKGKIAAKKDELEGRRILVLGPRGFRAGEAQLAENGGFTLADLPSGEALVQVLHGNWLCAEATVEVVPGKEATVPTLKLSDENNELPDPQVDARKVKLVDGGGKPVTGLKMWWSSRWMDGAIPSDKDGEILLVGGGVGIGLPPFRLRLGDMEGENGHFGGTLKKVASGTATVRIDPLRRVEGQVQTKDLSRAHYLLFAVSSGKTPRVYRGTVDKDGRYSVHLPPGTHTFVLGMVDGRLHRMELQLDAGEGALESDLVLP